MKKTIFSTIAQVDTLDFGSVLSRSIDLFKKVWVEGFIHLLLMILIAIPVIIVTYIVMFLIIGVNMFVVAGNPASFEQDFNPAMIPGFIGAFLLILLVSAVMQTFNIAIMAHFYKVCKNVDMGGVTESGGYFTYLKNGNFTKLLGVSFASMGIALLAILLCYFPIFYVMVPLTLLQVVLAFNPDLSISDLIHSSFKLGNKIWLPAFGMILLAGIISQLGMIACGIGVLFTSMFSRIPFYYIYKDTIGFYDTSQSSVEG